MHFSGKCLVSSKHRNAYRLFEYTLRFLSSLLFFLVTVLEVEEVDLHDGSHSVLHAGWLVMQPAGHAEVGTDLHVRASHVPVIEIKSTALSITTADFCACAQVSHCWILRNTVRDVLHFVLSVIIAHSI